MKLSLIQYLNIFFWIFSFRFHKAAAFFYFSEQKGMAQIFAYRKAKRFTRKEYAEIKNLIKPVDGGTEQK